MVSALVFIIVLGVLVFFHEMGHFLAAKACNIYVDRFSLGMPPRLFGIRLGETDYCVGALPIGGYVKMAGQEDAPLTEEEREKQYGGVPPERWFNNKPVWQRMIVIVAGPLMNVVLGILLYGIVAAVGTEVPETEVNAQIGYANPDSPAATAPMYRFSDAEMPASKVDTSGEPDAVGWKTSDRIISIDGENMDSFTDVSFAAILGAGKVLDVVIERTTDGQTVRYLSPVEPQIIEGGQHTRFGIEPFQTAVIAEVLPGHPASQAGLETGDIIRRANGETTDSSSFSHLLQDSGQPVTLEVERGKDRFTVTLKPIVMGAFDDIAFSPTPYTKDEEAREKPLSVSGITPDAKEKTGLRPGDLILEMNGEPVTTEELHEAIRENAGTPLTLKVKQPARFFGLLQPEEIKTVTLTPEPSEKIGIVWDTRMVFHRVPPLKVIPAAVGEGYKALSRTVETLAMLFTGTVSPKDLGGPVLIYQVTTAAADVGIMWLLKITAFISVNLCVFNLLPLPVLDGGLMLMLTYEGVRKKPLPEKAQERIQQVGLVIIISLLLFVTYNDILRWVTATL